MLREYAIHGLGKEPLSCLEWMCEAGVEMDRINLIAFLFSLWMPSGLKACITHGFSVLCFVQQWSTKLAWLRIFPTRTLTM